MNGGGNHTVFWAKWNGELQAHSNLFMYCKTNSLRTIHTIVFVNVVNVYNAMLLTSYPLGQRPSFASFYELNSLTFLGLVLLFSLLCSSTCSVISYWNAWWMYDLLSPTILLYVEIIYFRTFFLRCSKDKRNVCCWISNSLCSRHTHILHTSTN